MVGNESQHQLFEGYFHTKCFGIISEYHSHFSWKFISDEKLNCYFIENK